jgi:hypothetical protein
MVGEKVGSGTVSGEPVAIGFSTETVKVTGLESVGKVIVEGLTARGRSDGIERARGGAVGVVVKGSRGRGRIAKEKGVS